MYNTVKGGGFPVHYLQAVMGSHSPTRYEEDRSDKACGHLKINTGQNGKK